MFKMLKRFLVRNKSNQPVELEPQASVPSPSPRAARNYDHDDPSHRPSLNQDMSRRLQSDLSKLRAMREKATMSVTLPESTTDTTLIPLWTVANLLHGDQGSRIPTSEPTHGHGGEFTGPGASGSWTPDTAAPHIQNYSAPAETYSSPAASGGGGGYVDSGASSDGGSSGVGDGTIKIAPHMSRFSRRVHRRQALQL